MTLDATGGGGVKAPRTFLKIILVFTTISDMSISPGISQMFQRYFFPNCNLDCFTVILKYKVS